MKEYYIRLEKMKKLKEMGYSLYDKFTPTDNTDRLHKECESIEGEVLIEKKICVSLAGRVLSIRDFGGSVFFHIQDHTGKIQCFLERKKSEDLLKFFKDFVDTGDIVGLNGFLFKTKKRELTVYVEKLKLLTKSLRGLPEKWHGLKDVETRYRQRYLDLIMNAEVREIFEKKSKAISFLRRFFEERGFLEVETPLLHTIPGGALAKPFKTYHNVLDMNLYMRIAPELYLKRLITGGMNKVFEIGRNFRNEGVSSIHNPEFTMLEFYSAYSDYEELMSLTEELLYKLAGFINGKPVLKYGKEEIEVAIPFKRVDIPSSVSEYLNIPLNKIKDESFLRQKLGSKEFEDKTWGQIITEVFEKEIAVKIKQPTFVLGFPVDVSPLAKRRPDDKDFVERFELIVGGFEIANAFSELCDPDDQRERFQEQLKHKELREDLKELAVIDEDFLLALEYGMPPVAGEGIGIDRLVMLLVGASSIKDVILFPTMKPE